MAFDLIGVHPRPSAVNNPLELLRALRVLRGSKMPRHKPLLFFIPLACLAGGFLIALYANRNYHRPPPPAAIWAPPAKPITVVSYNILHNQRGLPAVIAEIQKLQPDIVCLQEVEKNDLSRMTELLGTYPAIYHPSENLADPHASWGNAICSRLPLYDAGTIPNPGGGSFGVWATALTPADNHKFQIACVHLSATWNANPAHLIESANNRWKELTNLSEAWRQLGSPPILIAGDFNQIPLGNNYALMTKEWSDALQQLGAAQPTFTGTPIQTRIDYFLLSKEWHATAGNAVNSNASDHKPIWLTAGAAPPH